jgi:hypothetical protein
VRKKLIVLGVTVAIVCGLLWWQRVTLLSWYYARGLAGATDADRALWIERTVSLDTGAVPGLIGLLHQDDPKVCANAEAALAALAKHWGPADLRTAKLAEEMTSHFGGLRNPGKEAVLEWHLATLHSADAAGIPQSLVASSNRLLLTAAQTADPGVRVRTLALAEMMLYRVAPAKGDFYRDLALQGFAAKETAVRVHAIRLAMHEPLHAEPELLKKVVPFLKDVDPEVRRAAVLAVGMAEEDTLSKQDLLALLQDPDAEVRRLCEKALRGRGLSDAHIKLAKLITDARPGYRIQVVNNLHDADDFGLAVWMQHLSEDPSPAVRAALIRFAAEDPAGADFEEGIVKMSREDPSPTVRQLALHYLKTVQRQK